MTSLAAVVAVAYENAVRYDEIRRQRAALELEIAERRRAEQVLRDSEQQLRVVADQLARSNQELSDFAAIASHDLREPLRGIYTYASIFLEDHGQKLEGDGRERIDAIMRLARRMYDLTEALLQYSRVGSIDLAWTETDLNRVVAEVLESLEPSLEEHAVSVRIPRPLPAIPCDHVRIGEVFRNLIVNAMKYNDKPQRWIEIAYEMVHGGVESGASDADTTHHSPLTTHVFYVRDNGIGIPAPQREAVFRIFKRLHGGSHFGNGTGAGLTICKKIIERHGGRIWVDSAEGEGSCFCFTLGGHPDVAQPRADFRR
jgi:light-regulated signal transduction histidine kinase (bacteriophytochrome)